MERLVAVQDALSAVLSFSLFRLGSADITVGTVLYVVFLVIMVSLLAGRVASWTDRTMQVVGQVDRGVRQAVAGIVRYLFIGFGVIIVLQSAGIDLSALTFLAGAAGIGIGLGLQNIINNFVSGLIILFERPVKVGDRVDVGSVHGDVVNIAARATTVVTNDNIAIIIPNSDFISSKVTNWSYTDRNVRFDVPVGVSYSSDPDQVTALLLAAAEQQPGVLADPAPDVLFEEFGDSSLNFTLQVWTAEYATRPRVLRSKMNYAIMSSFREHGVEIPFPQRDVNIRSGAPDGPAVDATRGT